MDEMTVEMTRFTELRPSEPPLNAHDLAELRAELFPTAAPPVAPPLNGRVIELGRRGRPEPSGSRRWLGAAAAAVAVLGGAGIWMAADRDRGPEETVPASQPDPSAPPASDAVQPSTTAVPRIALGDPGWTLTRAYEAPAAGIGTAELMSGTGRAAVFLSTQGVDGPWVDVTVVGPDDRGEIPRMRVGEIEAHVSEFERGTLVYWTTSSGVSLSAYGWGLDAEAMAPVLETVRLDGSAITFESLPDGATVAGPDVVRSLAWYAEYGFTHDDGRELQISFYAGGPRAQYSRVGDEERSEVTMGAERGSLLSYGDGRYRLNLERGFWAWELDGEPFESEQDFLDTAADITVVDEATWQASLPEGIVGSDDRKAVIDQLLTGVPLPDGFDRAGLESIGTNDRYQLIRQVSGAVVCTWLDQWFSAEETGDVGTQAAAAAALATSRDWPMLLEIDEQGGWSGAVWEHADAVNGGPGVVTGNGPVAPERELAESGLGCVF